MKKKKVKVGKISVYSEKGSKNHEMISQLSKTTAFESQQPFHAYQDVFKSPQKRAGPRSGDSNAFDSTKPTYLFHGYGSASAQDPDAFDSHERMDISTEIQQLRKLGIKKAASNDANAFFSGAKQKNLTFVAGSSDASSEFEF